MTRLKNHKILKESVVSKIPRPKIKRDGAPKDGKPRLITQDKLDKCRVAVDKLAGNLEPFLISRLTQRGVTEEEIKRYRMCETCYLTRAIDKSTCQSMTLELPDKLASFMSDSSTRIKYGVSIPYDSASGKFMGFITRIYQEPLVKYACSVPHRMCFGTDFSKQDAVWVTEGVFDAIALKRIGLNPLGQGDSQPNYFRMLMAARFEQINLLGDDDYAGWLGSIKAYVILTEMLDVDPNRIRILQLVGGKDAEEAIVSGNFNYKQVSLDDAVEMATKLAEAE